jgi:hypothetical protein
VLNLYKSYIILLSQWLFLPMFAAWIGLIWLPGADNCRRTAGSSQVLQAHFACCTPAEQRWTVFKRACLQDFKRVLEWSYMCFEELV